MSKFNKILKSPASIQKLLILLVVVMTTVEGLRCPSSASIDPCDCTTPVLPPVTPPTLRCALSAYTQEDVNKSITAYRIANGALVPTQRIELYRLILDGPFTSSVLDLTKLAHMDITTFELGATGEAIVGGTNSTDEVDIAPYRFSVRSMDAAYANLDDAKATELLKFIDPQNLTNLYLWYNDLTVVPDLTPFIKVTGLLLAQTGITWVRGGPFKTLTELDTIALDNMQLSEIGEEGLAIDRPLGENGTSPICANAPYPYACSIRLHHNSLTDEGIHENNGFDTWGGPTHLQLSSNKFEFASAAKFEKFLMTHPENELWLDYNPIVCDERSSWLKSKKEDYEQRVTGAYCTNDPGNTVFNSTLVP